MMPEQLLTITNDRAGSICSVRLRRRELQGVAARAGECLRAPESGRSVSGASRRKEQKVEQTRGEIILCEREAPIHRPPWPTAPPFSPAQPPTPRPYPAASRGRQGWPCSPGSPCRCRRSTPSMTAGTWPASSSCCSSSSPSSPWPCWPCSTSCWTVAAVPKARPTSSSARRAQPPAVAATARATCPRRSWCRARERWRRGGVGGEGEVEADVRRAGGRISQPSITTAFKAVPKGYMKRFIVH